jgi:arginyl-tRNA--protein-N-Asp/Glu arginylyltransferase
MSPSPLRLFVTPPHDCSYFASRQARTLFADPEIAFGDGLYQLLLQRGFRRSGSHIYRPDCSDCQACVSLRIDVEQWRPRRNQRRAWNRVADQLQITALPPSFNPEHFQLYHRYINSRHGDGDMANPTQADYLKFLVSDWCSTGFVEFRLQGQLVAVAVTDYLPDSLSAVYSFFDPRQAGLSPGMLCVLWQIQEARRLQLPHLYLGYWIEDCRKMRYKNSYRPNQHYINGDWISGAE